MTRLMCLVLAITMVLSVGVAATTTSYEDQYVQLMQDETTLTERIGSAVESVDRSRPDYQAGRQLRLLLRERGNLCDRAYALWDQHPEKLSAFWIYQGEMHLELSEASTIMAVEHRGGPQMYGLAADQMATAIMAYETAITALELGM